MRIEVDRLNETGEPFAQTYQADELSLEDERARLAAETKVAGHMSRQREQVRVSGKIETRVEVSCDLCLCPVIVPVDAEFEATYVSAETEAASPESSELQAEDLNLSFYEGESLDLDELVREQILLALPTRLVCREDCRGLCPTCGEDLNNQACACEQQEIDPRWAALTAMKRSES